MSYLFLKGEKMKNNLKFVFLVSLFLIASTTTLNSHNIIAQEDHDDHGAENECHDPTETVMINTHEGDLAFDKSEIKVTKGACVMFMFMNTQDQPHDFTIIKEDGHEWAHLHLDNSVDNSSGQGEGRRMIHLQMPDEDITLKYVCTVSGHEAAGMKGELVVGEGSPEEDEGLLPGFGVYTTIITLFALFIAVPRIRRAA
jgi:uncharacterized cupredoxin-like copper-binding protein